MLMRKVGYVFAAITVCVVIFAYLFWDANQSPTAAATFEVTGNNGATLWASSVAEFDEPWAMTFLPDGTMLVTTKPGKLFHVTQDGDKTEIDGLWGVAYGGLGASGVAKPQIGCPGGRLPLPAGPRLRGAPSPGRDRSPLVPDRVGRLRGHEGL